MTVATSHK